MIRGFVLMSGLLLAAAGIVLLLWLLWILWKFKTVEPKPPAIESRASEMGSEVETTPSAPSALTPAVEEGQEAPHGAPTKGPKEE